MCSFVKLYKLQYSSTYIIYCLVAVPVQTSEAEGIDAVYMKVSSLPVRVPEPTIEGPEPELVKSKVNLSNRPSMVDKIN